MRKSMNKHLEQLIKVVTLDREIDGMEPLILQKRSKLDKMLKSKESKELMIKQINEEKNDLQLRYNQINNSIEETSIRLEHITAKNQEVKSERELRALGIEEELAREQLNKANADIAAIEEARAQKDSQIQNLQDEIATIQSEIKTEEEAITGEIATIKAEQEKLFAKKQEIYATLEQKLAIFYEKIRKWAKNTSVVPVKKQACGGCFIRINDRVFAEIKQSNDIITCPHCGRILYIES